MAKNILILTGSPRKGGNTDQLADAFIAGAQWAGHTVTKYATADKNIKGCIDCKSCFANAGVCVIQDDFPALAPLMEQADMVVFATPLYWFSFPAQLKAAIDRFYSLFLGNRALKEKECALIAGCGDEDETAFAGMIKSYQLIAGFLNWRDRGMVLVPGLHDKDAVLSTEGLEKAAMLGKTLL